MDSGLEIYKNMIWHNFFGAMEYVKEIQALRMSIHSNPEHTKIIEKMFNESVLELYSETNKMVNIINPNPHSHD